MTINLIKENLNKLGFIIHNSNNLNKSKIALYATQKVEVVLKNGKVGCELEFEFIFEENSIEDGLEKSNLTQKLIDLKPLIDDIEKINIEDLKRDFISNYNNPVIPTTLFNKKNRINQSPSIDLESYLGSEGLQFGDIHLIFLVKCLNEVNNRMKKLENLIESSISKMNINENTIASEKLLVIDDVVKLLGLAKQTIYKKTRDKELPHFKRGKIIYFKESEIMEYINGGKILSNEEIEQKAAMNLKKK